MAKDKILCGVYAIVNKTNKKCYIGSSKNMIPRFYNGHLRALRNNKHTAFKLQRAWNKYGEEKFEFIVLKLTSLEKRKIEEEQLIEEFDSFENGYNSNEFGSGPNEYTISQIQKANARPERIEIARKLFTEYSRRPEVRKLSSERMKALIASGICSSKNPKTAAKISSAHKGKILSSITKKRISRTQKKRYKDPREVAKITKHLWGNTYLKDAWKNPRKRKKLLASTRKSTKEKWANPKTRKKALSALRNIWKNPDAVKKHQASRKRICGDPVWKKLHSEKIKKAWRNPKSKLFKRLKNK